MHRSELEDKWNDEKSVYECYSGSQIKEYHRLLINDRKRAEGLVADYTEKLADLNSKPGSQLGVQHYKEVKKFKARIREHTEKKNSADYRIKKIEVEIKDWFLTEQEKADREFGQPHHGH